MQQLTFRGQNKQRIRRSHSKIVLSEKESYVQLLDLAKRYDAQEFFSYKKKLPKNGLRFHYKVAAKGYRVGRDCLIYTGSRVYRVANRVRGNAQ